MTSGALLRLFSCWLSPGRLSLVWRSPGFALVHMFQYLSMHRPVDAMHMYMCCLMVPPLSYGWSSMIIVGWAGLLHAHTHLCEHSLSHAKMSARWLQHGRAMWHASNTICAATAMHCEANELLAEHSARLIGHESDHPQRWQPSQISADTHPVWANHWVHTYVSLR
jgi:hypothetical protein